jgi:hypothetical protein
MRARVADLLHLTSEEFDEVGAEIARVLAGVSAAGEPAAAFGVGRGVVELVVVVEG